VKAYLDFIKEKILNPKITHNRKKIKVPINSTAAVNVINEKIKAKKIKKNIDKK